MAALASAWKAFVLNEGQADTALRLELSAPPPIELLPLLPSVRVSADGALTLEGVGFSAQVSPDRRTCRIQQPESRLPLEAVVRVLLADSLLRRGGMLVHGVAVAHQGRAALFTGVSGAGKSTLGIWASRGGLTLLADELVALVPDGDGFTVHGTPWNVGMLVFVWLVLVGVLAHAPSPRLTPVAGSTVLRVLLSNVLEPGETTVRGQLFQIASRVLAATQTREFSFAPNLQAAAALKSALQ